MATGYEILLREVNGKYFIFTRTNPDNTLTVYSRSLEPIVTGNFIVGEDNSYINSEDGINILIQENV